MRAALGFVLALSTSLLPAQQPVFRAGAQTVSLYATVRDADGHLVPGLTKSDFQVLDDGRPAQITTFSNDVLPASLALLLDMSTSMTGEHLRVRDSALRFVDALLPGDRVRIGTFGDEIALSPWLTSDKQILARVLREEVWPGGETPLWSAMRAAMASIADETSRRVIVTLTDGIDTGCPRLIGKASSGQDDRVVRTRALRRPRDAGHVVRTLFDGAGRRTSTPDDARQLRTAPAGLCSSLTDVEKLAIDAEFMVYAIGMEGPGLGGGLIRLADESGGGHFELKRNADLAAAFHEVADELHHQYALGVTPVALDGRIHSIEVRLRRAGLTARARKSYLAAAK